MKPENWVCAFGEFCDIFRPGWCNAIHSISFLLDHPGFAPGSFLVLEFGSEGGQLGVELLADRNSVILVLTDLLLLCKRVLNHGVYVTQGRVSGK